MKNHDVSRRDLVRLIGAGAAASAFGPGARVLAQNDGADSAQNELVIGVQSMPTSLDPAVSGGSVVGSRTLYSIYDYLVECDYLAGEQPGLGSELVPGIAASWEQINDLTVEFTLR